MRAAAPAALDPELALRQPGGERRILGLLIESHLVAGRQDLSNTPLTYGQSVTDGCIDWANTVDVLYRLAEAVSGRRRAAA